MQGCAFLINSFISGLIAITWLETLDLSFYNAEMRTGRGSPFRWWGPEGLDCQGRHRSLTIHMVRDLLLTFPLFTHPPQSPGPGGTRLRLRGRGTRPRYQGRGSFYHLPRSEMAGDQTSTLPQYRTIYHEHHIHVPSSGLYGSPSLN